MRGYWVKLEAVTDGGYYICHAKADLNNEHDIHFHVDVNCELNTCDGATTIMNEMLATTDVAPNSINQITTIIDFTTASNSMVNRIIGDGQSSFQKRHISLIESSTASVQSSNSTSFPVSQSNQHINQYDVELSTTTESITTVRPMNVDHTIDLKIRKSSNRWTPPTRWYQMEKRRG